MKSSRIVFSNAASGVGGAAFGIGLRVAAVSGNGSGGSRRGERFPFGRYRKMNVAMARRAVLAKCNSQNEND